MDNFSGSVLRRLKNGDVIVLRGDGREVHLRVGTNSGWRPKRFQVRPPSKRDGPEPMPVDEFIRHNLDRI